MKEIIVKIRGISPYEQGKHYEVPKLEREIAKDYEARTWRERMHVDANGIVFIPPMALKNCLAEAAKFVGMQVPGKGKSTYTKHFEAGILIMEPATLGIKKDDVAGEWVFVPASGRRGDGKRVWKCFGRIPEGWEATFTVYVLDEIITKDVLAEHLKIAGSFIGLGVFRPRNNGYFGRFEAVSIHWPK